MPGPIILPPAAASPGGILNPSRVPFWGLNQDGVSCNEDQLYYPDPWDTFFINDIQLPGCCKLQNKSLTEIEVKKIKGKDNSGSTVHVYGYLPGEWDVISRIATPEQWLVHQEVQDKFWAGPSKVAKPPQITVKVGHPDLGRLRVYEGVLVGMPLAEDSDVEGAKNFRWRFTERSPVKAHKAKKAGGPIPEDKRLIGSAETPDNYRQRMPSTDPKNLGLEGPPPKRD